MCGRSQAQTEDPYAKWEDAISAFEKADSDSPPLPESILFIGSSSIRMWSSVADDMSPMPVINRGFGGSQIDDSVHFANRIVFPYKPSAIVFYAGDNDIAAKKTPETLLADFARFEKLVHAVLHDTPIYYIAIKPSPSRWSMWENMKRANALIEKYTIEHSGCVFIDVATPMLGSDGNPRKELFLDDNLHMNADGYRLWTSIVRPRLEAFRTQ